MKKLVSVLLVSALMLSMCVFFSGCGNGKNYPVKVANITIEKKPDKITVLSAETADIISYMGYDVKLVGRSDNVNQDFLSIVPSVGSASAPNVDLIKAYDTDVVFSTSELGNEEKTALERAGILVVNMAIPQTPTELEVAYVTIGRIMEGNSTGVANAERSYKELVQAMKNASISVDKGNIQKTVCYIYTDDKNTLRTLYSGTYGDFLLNSTGATNAAVNVTDSEIDPQVLAIANPDCIFYADEQTLNFIKNEKDLKNLNALKYNSIYMVSQDEINRMGSTALITLNKMISCVYSNNQQPQQNNNNNTEQPTQGNNSTQETQPVQEPAKSVANEYNIKIDNLSLKKDQENNNVKIVQQRLYDLGYVDDIENVTGYYGGVTETAVKEFQKKNGIKETGVADNTTIKKLFMSDAKKK